jgi:hypothetical protein
MGINLNAFIRLRIKEISIKQSANSVLKVHNDSVIHLIDIYNFDAHVGILILFPVNVSPASNNGILLGHLDHLLQSTQQRLWFIFHCGAGFGNGFIGIGANAEDGHEPPLRVNGGN